MTTPLTDQQLDEIAAVVRNAPLVGADIDPGTAAALLAEIDRLREKHKASLRRADKLNNELMEEVQRYAAGTERPVLWSVYNDMHLRAANAEGTLERVRRVVSRLAAHAVGFQDVLDESDRGPWAKTVGADIAELSAALSPDAIPAPPVVPLAASQPPEVPVAPETSTGPPAVRLGDSGAEAARIALTRSDLASMLAHHADVLAAQLRTDPARDAWIAAERLTEHANELTAETERPAVTELLDNIWTFPMEQPFAAGETSR